MTSAQGHSDSSWEVIGRQKRESIAALLPEKWRMQSIPSPHEAPDAISIARECLSLREIQITENYNVVHLAEKIANKTYTSVEVTEAFCHRATLAHQLVSGLLSVCLSPESAY